jgi:hypothetical protein
VTPRRGDSPIDPETYRWDSDYDPYLVGYDGGMFFSGAERWPPTATGPSLCTHHRMSGGSPTPTSRRRVLRPNHAMMDHAAAGKGPITISLSPVELGVLWIWATRWCRGRGSTTRSSCPERTRTISDRLSRAIAGPLRLPDTIVGLTPSVSRRAWRVELYRTPPSGMTKQTPAPRAPRATRTNRVRTRTVIAAAARAGIA